MRPIDWTHDKILPWIDLLLTDHSTGECVQWANGRQGTISRADVLTGEIQPRCLKSKTDQGKRTKSKGEVFTPAWVCGEMNAVIDKEFAGISWQEYVLKNGLEITCGEGAFLVSRYDASTGETIHVKDRIGFLDKKIMVVSDNVKRKTKWIEWVTKAFMHSYAFEFQGDSLLIARINALLSFIEHFKYRWGVNLDNADIERIVRIISWNLWQMDGLTDCVPFTDIPCRIMSWQDNETVEFRTLKTNKEKRK